MAYRIIAKHAQTYEPWFIAHRAMLPRYDVRYRWVVGREGKHAGMHGLPCQHNLLWLTMPNLRRNPRPSISHLRTCSLSCVLQGLRLQQDRASAPRRLALVQVRA